MKWLLWLVVARIVTSDFGRYSHYLISVRLWEVMKEICFRNTRARQALYWRMNLKARFTILHSSLYSQVIKRVYLLSDGDSAMTALRSLRKPQANSKTFAYSLARLTLQCAFGSLIKKQGFGQLNLLLELCKATNTLITVPNSYQMTKKY